ncbi:MAG: ferredoxin [Patescibacteria group bacterium]
MKIKLEREKCIGCGSCWIICPDYFETAEDGKSHIKDSPPAQAGNKADIEELEIEKIKCSESAAEACPTQCIIIEK